MQQDVIKAIEDTINNRMGGICEGALWMEHNGYGPHIEHYGNPYEVVEVLKEKQYATEIEHETRISIYLVPKGEGYKNSHSPYSNHDDWVNLILSYGWVLAYSVTLEIPTQEQISTDPLK